MSCGKGRVRIHAAFVYSGVCTFPYPYPYPSPEFLIRCGVLGRFEELG